MKKYLIALCLIFAAICSWAQTREITGQVVGVNKDTLIGALVVQKGTSNAVSTDPEGNFALSIPDSGNVELMVQYAGYKDTSVAVGDQSHIVITMREDKEEVDEVVVVGYGTVKKSDLTGSVVSLKPKDVTQVPSGNVLDAIQGKAAGVDITRTSGEAGKAPDVTVRGTRSITAGNGPLFIVDGVQYSSIQDISPNDIQSMEVLKDPSSTAIYGSRGANGVIIVTTRRGASGVPKVTVNAYTGVSGVLAYPRAMNADEYTQLKREVYRTQNPSDPEITNAEALSPDEYNNYVNGLATDYTKAVLHQGAQKNLEIGITGGTDKLKTYFSLGYFNEKGLLRNDVLNRYTARLNLDYQVKKFLKVGIQSQLTYYDQNKRANPLGNASKISPLTRAYDDNGEIIIMPNGKHANPLLDEQANTAVDKLKTTRIFPTIYAELIPFKGFKARTNLALNWDNRSEGIFNSANSYTVINSGANMAQASHDANYRSQLNWQGILSYNKSFGDHAIDVMGLSEIIDNKAERYFLQANNQLIAEQLYYNLGDNTSRLTNSRYIQSTLVSFAGRVNYSFKGKYLVTMTGRSDGASVLAEGHKWDFFPSIAGGWRISDEKFMLKQNIFSTLKLRTSWGITGNSNIDAYSTQSSLVRVPFSYDLEGVTAYVYRPQIGNPDTRWEKSRTIDVGLDLGLLQERITATFDYYDTHTNGLLLTEKLPLSTGVAQTVSNVGKTRNRGVELTATSVNIQRKKFTWTTTLTFMKNKEQVIALTDGLNTMQVTTTDDMGSQNTKTVVVGYPVNSFYDYEKVGIWQLNETDEAAKYGQKPGMIHIKDQNGDGKITPEDRVVVGSTVPKWSAGFNSEFKFLNFDVSFYLFSRVGQTINYQYAYDPSGAQNSLSTREYWTPENPVNDLPRPGYSIESQYLKTINYTNGSFLKLRSATIGYTFPSSILNKIGVSRFRVYVTGKNLLVISKIKRYDPEMQGNLTFPTVRLVVGGINFEF